MDNLFFSKNNFENIHNNLLNFFKNEYNINIENNYNSIIKQLMEFVYSKVDALPPKGMSNKHYNNLLNTKVIKTGIKVINNKINSNNSNNSNNYNNNGSIGGSIGGNNMQNSKEMQNLLDTSVLIPNEQQELMNPPAIQGYNENVNNRYESLEQNRFVDQPKEIDFKLPSDNNYDSNQLYNKLIEDRGISNSNNIPIDKSANRLEPVNNFKNDNLSTNINDIENYSNQLISNDNLKDSININRNNTIEIINKVDNAHELFYKEDKKNLEQFNLKIKNELTDLYKSPVILPPKVDLKEYIKFVTIDSKDRNLELYPDASNFLVKFSPPSDSTEKVFYYDSNNLLIYETTASYLGSTNIGAYISTTYTNIVEIKIISIIVPYSVDWVCGDTPDCYNPANIDKNVIVDDATSNTFPSGPYGPIWTSKTGIAKTVLNEPYLILNIEELDGPYQGTNLANNNAFAKLIVKSDTRRGLYGSQVSSFVTLGTENNNESFKYLPTNLGKLDKITLKLLNSDNNIYSFGQDKIYITNIISDKYDLESFKNDNCKFNIKPVLNPNNCDDLYNDNFIQIANNCNKSHEFHKHIVMAIDIRSYAKNILISPGDLLYFYNTKPYKFNIINLKKT